MAFPLLLDAMIPRSLFQALQREGYQVKHALDLDFNIVQNDESLLEYATEHRHVLFTCNYADPEDNFVQIDRQWREQGKEHAGIVLCPQTRISFRLWEVHDRLLELLDSRTAEQLWNTLIWLP